MVYGTTVYGGDTAATGADAGCGTVFALKP